MADHAPIATPASGLRIVVVTPEQTVLDTTTDFVALPLYDGELGVAPGHAPMIGRLGYGELRIGRLPGEQSFYVDGGFVQVADNVVSVLTNRAVPANRLDAGTIEDQIQQMLAAPAAGEEAMARRDRAIAQSRAQLRTARRQSPAAARH
jgi:F-type H+-transporting ATPase subunit epsilon